MIDPMSPTHPTVSSPRAGDVRLRPVVREDLPRLFEFQGDPEGCALAGVRPRTWESFVAVWDKSFADPTVVSRAILADGLLAGSIGCFRMAEGVGAGLDSVGYWIARDHWGRGVASRALALFIAEVPHRPLHAQDAAENAASLKVLARSGFTETGRRHDPGSDRYVAGEVVELTLH